MSQIDGNQLSTPVLEVVNGLDADHRDTCKSILNILMESSKTNQPLNKHRHIFTYNLKHLSLYVFLTAGRKSYEFLRVNMDNALPAISTVHNYLSEKEHRIEGVCDFDGLKRYLEENNLPKVIFVCEDQTKVTKKIRYDKQTNCLIGFVAPSSKNGLPRPFYFKASSSLHKSYFDNHAKASFVNILLAQPLSARAAPFCLTVYGSNNCFTSVDVKNRWTFIENECRARSILHIGNAGDGDSKLLKVMKSDAGFGKVHMEESPWFIVSISHYTFNIR